MKLRPPPYAHTYPEHPGSGCWGCTPLSHEIDWLRAQVAAATAYAAVATKRAMDAEQERDALRQEIEALRKR